jgi:hypothetical protein
VADLADRRAVALEAGSRPLLARVDEPGSAAEREDAALLERLQERGLRLEGLSFVVGPVAPATDATVPAPTVPGTDALGTTLPVTAQIATSAHRQVRGDGVVVQQVPAGPARTVRLVLVAGPRGWMIRSAG